MEISKNIKSFLTIGIILIILVGLGGGAAYASSHAHTQTYKQTEEKNKTQINKGVSETVHQRVLQKQEKNIARHKLKFQETKAKVAKKKNSH